MRIILDFGFAIYKAPDELDSCSSIFKYKYTYLLISNYDLPYFSWGRFISENCAMSCATAGEKDCTDLIKHRYPQHIIITLSFIKIKYYESHESVYLSLAK